MVLSSIEFGKRAAILVALASLAFLAWQLRDFFLVLVGALLVALLLEVVSEPLVGWARLPRGLALTLSGLLVLAAIGGSAFVFGTRMSAELGDVLSRADD